GIRAFHVTGVQTCALPIYSNPEDPMNVHVPANRALAERLRRETRGEVLFDRFSRGRYSTDASIYQIEPVGVVVPRTDEDVQAARSEERRVGKERWSTSVR